MIHLAYRPILPPPGEPLVETMKCANCEKLVIVGDPYCRYCGERASPEHFTLCRCGGSKNKPFCDGTHWYKKFTDDKN